MRAFLHALRVVFYLLAFVSLFCGSNLFGYTKWDFHALLIDLGMAAVFALLGLCVSYIRKYATKPPDSDSEKRTK